MKSTWILVSDVVGDGAVRVHQRLGLTQMGGLGQEKGRARVYKPQTQQGYLAHKKHHPTT